MDRTILHCDCNSFFASVEAALNPELKTVPMAVCGSEENRHGIVLAKNELAKSYGIITTDTVYTARRKCPELVIVKPHYEDYADYSRRINEIYREYTDIVEPFGIDESWLDVTSSTRLFGNGEQIAESIRQRIKKEIGVTVSIGVSFNKPFAKLGSDYKKPDAITVISRENFRTLVYPLPVGDLLFVGSKTASELNKIGVRTIGELAELEFEFLLTRFGKMGSLLYSYSRGLDDSPVLSDADRENAKSISNGFTFKYDLTDKEQCRTAIDYLCDEIGYKLRAKDMKCTTVTLTVKDVYLKSTQRQRRLESETDISSEISNVAFSILCDTWPQGKAIRMLTVGASGLVNSSSGATQLDIFGVDDEKERERKRNVEKTVDILRQKFGQSCVVRGSILQNSFGLGDDE